MGLIRDTLLAVFPVRRLRQVGALPYRRAASGSIEVLLVTVRKGERWTLPKGWPAFLRSGADAAAREAFEEGGVRGEIDQRSCGWYNHPKKAGRRRTIICRVVVYPLAVETVLDDWPEAAQRRRRWFSLRDAASASDNQSLSMLLAAFERRMLSDAEPRQQS